MVFCNQNYSDSDILWEKIGFFVWEKLLKFEAGVQEFAKFLKSLFIQTVRTIFGNIMLF